MNTRCPPKRVPSAARFFTLCRLTVQPPQSYSVRGQRSSGQLTGKPAGARPAYRGRWCAGCLGCARSRGAWPEPRGRGLPPPLGRHPPRCGLTNAGWPRADTPEGAVILPRDCACCCGGALRHWRSCGRLGWNGLLGHIFANCCDASRALTERCSISSTAGPNVCPGEIGASSNGTLSGSCTLACESQSCLLATTREAMLLPCARAFNWANLTSNCATVPSSVLRAADGHSGRSRKSAAW
ncbi:UNVERIFIED_CONTAM: hypothetical protein FKN15_016100 [Acipenser sinensis]